MRPHDNQTNVKISFPFFPGNHLHWRYLWRVQFFKKTINYIKIWKLEPNNLPAFKEKDSGCFIFRSILHRKMTTLKDFFLVQLCFDRAQVPSHMQLRSTCMGTNTKFTPFIPLGNVVSYQITGCKSSVTRLTGRGPMVKLSAIGINSRKSNILSPWI